MDDCKWWNTWVWIRNDLRRVDPIATEKALGPKPLYLKIDDFYIALAEVFEEQ